LPNKASSASGASDLTTDGSDLEELFSQLDSDGDGKVTEQEFTDSLAQLDEQVDNLFSQMRLDEAQNGMRPPPAPPPSESDSSQATGFTAEELTAQLGTNEKMMLQIMRLVQAYNLTGGAESTGSSTLSITT
jgi:hypothetical protein